MSERGKLIVVEGNDGTGKSTQVELLSDHLNDIGIETYVTHEPGGTPISNEIRKVIKNGELDRGRLTNLLLFTAARHENWRVAKRELMLGKWVISARNYLSTEVYQGYGEGIPIDLIHNITRQFTDGMYMNPDFTFVLSLNDEERKRRINDRGLLETKDTFESRGHEFQEKLNIGYLELAKKYGFKIIDAGQSVDEIQAEIRKLIGLDA